MNCLTNVPLVNVRVIIKCTVFSDNFRSEVDIDVISAAVVDQIGLDVSVKLVNLGQTVLEIYEPLTLSRPMADGGHDIRQKRHLVFCLNKKPTNWLDKAKRCTTKI